MVLVPANMSRFDFNPCNYFFVFGLCKMLGTNLKNKTFCRDLFKNQNILQGLFFYKMGSVIMCHVCKSSQK